MTRVGGPIQIWRAQNVSGCSVSTICAPPHIAALYEGSASTGPLPKRLKDVESIRAECEEIQFSASWHSEYVLDLFG